MGFVRKLLGHKDEKADAAAASNDTPLVEAGEARPPARARHVRVGTASDVGLVRNHNEDVLLTFTSEQHADGALDVFGVFILADGMGGHQAGEVASSLAARTVGREVIEQVYLPYLVHGRPDPSQTPLAEALVQAVDEASKMVYNNVPGGGTTLTCMVLVNDRAVFAHVGDSRAYLYHGNALRQITKDHSYVDKLVELGQLTAEEAAAHPQKNVLYRAVGQEGPLEVDTHLEVLPAGSRLLLCCDGLWSMIDDKQISRILGSAATPQAACEQLVTAANAAGGRDNITAIVVEMDG
ncbi:MAG TPA: Stp1/IreP family PP2C-type Ser/Thr phosphatase [Anaerolineae bacterium]|nr:Stp1/IreP family PP2C-type Ser/Thr phosphatase [Anaerolineae bacterium]